MSFFVKAVLMSVLPFYRVDFVADPFPDKVTYLAYKGGVVIGKRDLGGSEISALKELLKNNKSGWRYDLISYAPGHVFVSSNMKINCLDGGALVVNYLGKDAKWVQISKNKFVGACPAVNMQGT